jgi:hypothetical protein
MEHGPKEFIMLLLLLLLAPGMLLVLRPYRLAKKVAAKYRSLNDHALDLGITIMLISLVIDVIVGYEQTPFALLFPPGLPLAGILLTPLGLILLFLCSLQPLASCLIIGPPIRTRRTSSSSCLLN